MDTGILGSRVWAFKPRGIRLVVEGLYLLGGGGPGVEDFRHFRGLRVYDRSTSRTVALSLSLFVRVRVAWGAARYTEKTILLLNVAVLGAFGAARLLRCRRRAERM